MSRSIKDSFLQELQSRFPSLRRLNTSRSLFEIPEIRARVYVRYSKLHSGARTFYGLRSVDIRALEGHSSVICFLWDGQETPLLIPFGAFEDVFSSTKPAADGQIKVQVYPDAQAAELYVAGVGRFNVEGYFGWNELNHFVSFTASNASPNLTHPQIQTLLAAIGYVKGNDVWLPIADRAGVDFSLTNEFPVHKRLPEKFQNVEPILSEVDVVWLKRGSGDLEALFEVEHTTAIYSGLLRFNDVHLEAPSLKTRFSIVANDARRGLFVRQVNRPTFKRSGLAEVCTFMEYANVIDWHSRLIGLNT